MAFCAEDIQQIIVIEFIKQCTNLPVVHIANQRSTSPQHGSMLKRMGVRKGCSDLFIPRATSIHHGFWLELKTLKGKPTQEQIQFLDEMRSEGYMTAVCYGSQHAINTIKEVYNL